MVEIYQELKTEYGIMRGFLHQPEVNDKIPLVILYHGFTGNKIDNKFLFVNFARYLYKHNIACLRFDFIGSGESDCDFSAMTFLSEVEQGELVLDYAKTLSFYSEIVVMGFSMGGAVATQVAKNRYNDIDKLVLWSPAGNMANLAENYFKNNLILNNGNCDIGGLELNKDFYEQLKVTDLYLGVEVFDKPVIICHGTKDLAVPLIYGEKYSQVYKQCLYYPIEGADHVYSSLAFRNDIFSKTTNFILENKKNK